MAAASGGCCYLCVFAQEHVKFRIEELVSVSTIFGIEIESSLKNHREESPFLMLELADEECARKLASRTLLVKSVLELWGHGKTLTDLKESVQQLSTEKMKPYCRVDTSFKIAVQAFNKKLSMERQKEFIEELAFVPFQGQVDLSNPDQTFVLMLDYGEDSNATTDEPVRMFLGRLICSGQRHLIKEFSLKTRRFIGNTSMDAQLAFIMANQGLVRPGCLVYDPFVGTGSVLLSCSRFGAHTAGSDIDRTLLHGRGKPSRAGTKCKWRARDESIRANFRQYGLEGLFVDAIVSDAARQILRPQPLFDAIVTDPPYGVREGVRKLEATNRTAADMREEMAMPAVHGCCLSEVLTTLLNFAARHLVLHGRLVYWLPVHRRSFSDSLIPTHPCLKLLANSEQVLNEKVSRRLLTMEKIKEFQERDLLHIDENAKQLHDTFRGNYFRVREQRTEKESREQKTKPE